MNLDKFYTHSLQDARVARILLAALEAVEPGRLVAEYLEKTPLPAHERLFLLGLGKASESMVLAAARALPHFYGALVITKHALSPTKARLRILEGGHPLPDARSVMAGRAALDFVRDLREQDLLVCLISGGGSALATVPRSGIGLREMQVVTGALLSAGASIDEINTLRRHLDLIKGGNLARATRAQVVSLLLSDVIGNRPEDIASGPTASDPTSGTDALAILNKYDVPVSSAVYSVLSSQYEDGGAIGKVRNEVVGSILRATQAAQIQAHHDGFAAEILQTDLQGDARVAGRQLSGALRSALGLKARPFCLIVGGETTVRLRGNGKGGRNQELALASVDALAGLPDVMLVTFATDGDDGPTDAAGAVVTGDTQSRSRAIGMQASDYLARSDSYTFFKALGDLLKPGYSGTNVNDLTLLLGL